MMGNNPLRDLPAVNDVLETAAIQELRASQGHDVIVAVIRDELSELRRRVGQGETVDGRADAETVAGRVAQRLGRELQPKLRPVINATGIVLHTNLGRAPIAEQAA